MNNSERLKQILVVIATIGVIFINYLAGIGAINAITPQVISEKYPTLITPAGYAFAIWAIIYSGLIIFAIYQALPSNKEHLAKIRTLYIVNCAANCAWIYLWHHEQILASLLVMFVLLGSLALINVKLRDTDSMSETLFVKLPFNIYFGWVSVATIINFTIALVANGVNVSNSVAVICACLLIAIATILGIIIRLKLNNAVFPIVIAWALTAIAVKQNLQTALIICAAFGVIISLIASISVLLQTSKNANE